MHKNKIKYIKILAILLFIILLSGCGVNSNEKIITNIQDGIEEETTENSKESKETIEEHRLDENEIQEDSLQKDMTVKEKVPVNENKDDKGNDKDDKDESEVVIKDNKESSEDIVVIDGVTYKNYKGPVQGEIKYEEGRPADQNSGNYKASGDIESPYEVDLVVTTNYGHEKVFGKSVGLVKDEVGMEVLFRNLDIQTAYGGGFVNAINGIESKYTFYTGKDRKKKDWFYWVNGILAPIGIAEYRVQPGDVIWWDYHDWSMTMFTPAVIGSYPQPFKSGFWGKNSGTVIMYTENYKDKAGKLKESLVKKGVEQIDVVPYDAEVLEETKKYQILVGTWDELSKDSTLIQDINKKNKFKGVYVKFEDGKLNALDFKGKVVNSYDNAGTIYAYASGIGSINPIWMVTGINEDGVNMALDVLLERPEDIDKHFSAIITEDNVINVPHIE